MRDDCADSVDKCQGRPWRFPIASSDQLVTKLSAYTRCIIYSQLSTIHHGLNILTSNWMLHRILAGSGLADDFCMCILGPIFWKVHWQCRGGITCVCIHAMCLGVTHWMKRPSIGFLPILRHLVEVVVYSVSNGSKFPGRFRVRFQPGTEPLQRVFTQNPLLKSQHLLHQLSIWVLIVSQHEQYVDCAVLVAPSPRACRLRSDKYSLSRDWKPANFADIQPVFHSHSTNISRIANLKAGGARVTNAAQFTYWSCHDTIRTQILNWSQSCRNRKMKPRSGSNPSPNPVGTPGPRVTTWTGQSGPVPNPDRSRVTRNRC